MAHHPPPLPGEILARVQRLATIDGYLLLFVAGGFALQAAMMNDAVGAIAGCLAAGAGAMEITGLHALQRGQPGGMNALVRSQLFLLGVILTYAAVRMLHPQIPEIERLPDWYRAMVRARGLSDEQLRQLLLIAAQLTYCVVGIVSIAYQGGMALYYYRRRDAVRTALENGPASARES